MKLYRHNNYEDYKRSQKSHVSNHQRIVKSKGLTSESGEKLGWAKDEHLDYIFKGICSYLGEDPKLMICHGVRNGYESKFFMDRIGADNVFSTDLANVFMYDKKNFFPKDFDSVVPMWQEKFDALYSNSVDHSRDPATTLAVWGDQVKSGGVLSVVFSCGPRATDCDCFALDVEKAQQEILDLIKGSSLEMLECSALQYGAKHRDRGTINVFFRKK
jgi:hypothetical protein